MITKSRNILAALVATTAIAAVSIPASAQMFEGAYQNNQRDGAGLAVVMKQVDEGMFSSNSGSQVVGGGGSSEILLCGGDGSEGSTSGATANSSCMIIGDGAIANINLGQESDGDQNANSDVDTELSDTLEGLGG